MSQPQATVLAALISAIIGGVAAAVVSYLLNRRKTSAETEKIRAETEKLHVEIRNLSESVSYSLPQVEEQIIFDGRERIDGFDVRGAGGSFWQGQGSDARPASPKGEGTLEIEEGRVLNIQRTNMEGRFEVFFQQYRYGDKTYASIPKNDLIAGKRKLRISCEAKAVGGDHTLRFVVRNPTTGQRLAEDLKRISGNDWRPVEVFLRADPTVDSEVRLDDETVSAVPSSVQLRRIVIAERTA